jgi:hypothetical protein
MSPCGVSESAVHTVGPIQRLRAAYRAAEEESVREELHYGVAVLREPRPARQWRHDFIHFCNDGSTMTFRRAQQSQQQRVVAPMRTDRGGTRRREVLVRSSTVLSGSVVTVGLAA